MSYIQQCEMVGSSPAMVRLRQEIAVAAKANTKVRLNEIGIHVPPLRNRPEDIPELLEHFTARFSQQHGVPCPPIGADAMAWLKAYSWPGNVRELRNMAERFVVRKELLAAVECPA